MDLKNKLVTVIGLGNSGVNAAILAREAGASVRGTDLHDTPSIRDAKKLLEGKGINVEIGGHTKGFIRGSGLVVVSPGVEAGSPALRWAGEFKIPVIGEMELGFGFCKGRIIAITGTNGKSTVTTLAGEILKDGGVDAVVCGNIGNSLCGEIPRIKYNTWVLLEVSSFQLERIEDFKPHIAVILNVTDDHMDRYRSFNEYINEKLKIFANQDKGDILIVNYDDKKLRGLAGKAKSKVLFFSRFEKTLGACLEGNQIWCGPDGRARKICGIDDMRLKGLHNVENVLACCLIGVIAGVKEGSIRDTVRNFKGLSHRFQAVGFIDGVEYIDDSKGTTVDSTCRALESCAGPVILIAGGKDKHSDYSVARDIVARKVRDLVLIGEAKGAIKKALEGACAVHEVKDMFEAVVAAHKLAGTDCVVLLSPMCSSFDMFKDYRQRGEVFREAVERLSKTYV
ncbi:MAG: UDP-N-acetylmuramoyl-L-alanine--D-glutamate ligase [Candidatus Omnitrophota bacterium]|nr:UDP-N-acetylmuramoyl-L-alanine--D-glutamate ligase [Candidatus Omnitrophota bacterium]